MAKEYVEVEVTVSFRTLIDADKYKLEDDEVMSDEKLYDRFKYELDNRKHSMLHELQTVSSYSITVEGTDDSDE